MASSFDAIINRLEAAVKRQEAALLVSKTQLAEAKALRDAQQKDQKK